jgi:hypothetical protein
MCDRLLVQVKVYVNVEALFVWLDFFSNNCLYLAESLRLLFGCTPLGWLIFTYMVIAVVMLFLSMKV